MYLTGSGIANNTYVTAITPNTSFTISANATATNTSEGVNANYLNANTTISSITNSTTFVLSAGPSSLYSGSGLALAATTINHNYTLEQCTIPTADLTANMKLRFQFSGYNGTPPNQPPTVDIDDVVVNLTAPGTITTTEAMTNASGNVYSAQIPAAVNTLGATVSYYVTATDSNSLTSTDPSVRRYHEILLYRDRGGAGDQRNGPVSGHGDVGRAGRDYHHGDRLGRDADRGQPRLQHRLGSGHRGHDQPGERGLHGRDPRPVRRHDRPLLHFRHEQRQRDHHRPGQLPCSRSATCTPTRSARRA